MKKEYIKPNIKTHLFMMKAAMLEGSITIDNNGGNGDDATAKGNSMWIFMEDEEE